MWFAACRKPATAGSSTKPPKPSRLALFFTGRKGSGEAAAAEDALTTAPPQVELPNAFMLVFDILSEGSAAPPSAAPSACTSEVPETAVCAATCAITECAAKLAAARGAKAHRTACMALADFGAGIVEALDAKGPRALASADPADLTSLASLLSDAVGLATAAAAPGWLLAAAVPNSDHCEAMAALHAGALATLNRVQGLDAAHGVRLAPPCDYMVCAPRALHRRLRQLGAGSLRAGLEVLAGSEEEQRALAAMLGVEPEDVRADAAYILEAGLAPAEPSHATCAAAAGDAAVAALRPELRRAFAAFAAYGARESGEGQLDSFRCAKLAREAGLLGGGRLSAQQLDVLFCQAKDRGARRLTFDAFLRLLALMADVRGAELAEVAGAVAALQAPSANGATTPDWVRFHDDRSTYTGVYARGGPTSVDDHMLLSKMVDRGAAERAARRSTTAGGRTPPLSRTDTGGGSGALTPRGDGCATPRGPPPASFGRPGVPRLALPAAGSGQTTPRFAGPASARGAPAAPRLTPPLSARGPAFAAAFHTTPLLSARGVPKSARGQPTSHALTPSAFHTTPPPAPACELRSQSLSAEDDASLRSTFGAFAAFGKTSAQATAGTEAALDSAQFAKLCRDAGLLNRHLSATRVDLIFSAAVPKGGRRLAYPTFLAALPRLAEARCCTEREVVRTLATCAGPSRTAGTTPEPGVSLADRSNFSGVATRGGPTTVDKRITLASLTDRSGRAPTHVE